MFSPPDISQCKTRCYLPCWNEGILEVALPGGEVLRKVDGMSKSVFACGSVVVSCGADGASAYDEDLTLLRSLSRVRCRDVAVSDCGGWVITSSLSEKNARLWDVNTGEAVACVRADRHVALSRSASVFAVGGCVDEVARVQLYDWSGTALQKATLCGRDVIYLQFTPCGKYLVVQVRKRTDAGVPYAELHQYDVATMSCVFVIPDVYGLSFAISPCSRVVVFLSSINVSVLTPHSE